MAITQNTFTGDGSTTNYSFTFEYIKQADVKASLDGTVTTAFTLANATTLSFNTAPASGVAIRIFRDTAIDNLKATFSPGSAIKAEDLNDNFTQNNFAVQEADFDVATANTTANTAKTTADSATATANTASTNASNAVTTANTASTNASAAVSTANTASTNASNAVTTANAATATANTADANATTALNNSRESDGQGGFTTAITKANNAVTTANTASTNATSAVNTANAATTTANTASTNASNAVTTANSAASDAATAISTANTASTNASNAVSTANTASTNASNAVSTANTASTNASNAVSTANTASTNATAALNNSRESDGQGGFTSAISKANTAITTANTASAAVSNAVLFDLITNVSSIPSSPSNNDYAEIGNSTGIESFSPLSGLPSGFTGAAGLTVRIRYDSSASSWVFMSYFANDSETRYVAIGNPNPTYYANQSAFPSATTYHGGVAHSHADGAMYYAHGGNWIKMAKDSDVTTKLPLAGGTLTGNLTLSGAPTSNLHAATKSYVDTEVAGLVDSAPGTLDTLNELAAALGDDANFSTTVTNSIATKMPLAGGTFTGNVDFNDNVKARFGTGDDVELFHSGSASFFYNKTGHLYIDTQVSSGQINFTAGDVSEYMIKAVRDAQVELYYNGSEKLATKSDGVNITGELECDSLDVDGNATFDGTLNTGVTGTGVFLYTDGTFQSWNGGNLRASIATNGNATFAGEVNIGGYNGSSTTTNGVLLGSVGGVFSQLPASDNGTGVLFQGMKGSTYTSRITSAGNAEFDGQIRSDRFKCGNNADQDKIILNNDGSTSFADGALTISSSGWLQTSEEITGNRSTGQYIYRGKLNGTVTSSIIADGSATFKGNVLAQDSTNYYSQLGNQGRIILKGGQGGNYLEAYTSGGTEVARIETDGDAVFAGTVTDSIGNVRRVGIDNVTGGSGIIGTSAAGKLLRVSSSNITLTIPSGTYTAGDMITFFNVSATNLTIAQGSSTTIYNAADGSTGNRTLAAKGLATLVCTASNEFIISGSGLS